MARRIALLAGFVIFSCIPCARAQSIDPYTSEFEKSPPEANIVSRLWLEKETRDRQQEHLLRIAVPEAVKSCEPPADSSESPQSEQAKHLKFGFISDDRLKDFAMAAVLLLAGIVVARYVAPRVAAFMNGRRNPWLPVTAAGPALKVLAEEHSFTEFASSFQIGPAQREGTTEKPETDPWMAYFKESSGRITALRNALQLIGPKADRGAQKINLEDLALGIRRLKRGTSAPELLPIWQLACGIEGLLNQLIGKTDRLTVSALRTLAQAIDLIEQLSVPGLRADLATNPPIRLLAVDDDPISRHALSFALRKALNTPDLARNADEALPLCEKEHYDVIFLDVQMPGMDGFELCSKIHATAKNRMTPVVFVTCQSDFAARAKSSLAGGHDLMGKPFMTFEIALKALALVLRARLQPQAAPADKPLASTADKPQEPKASPTPATAQEEESPPKPKQPAQPRKSLRRKRRQQQRQALSREALREGRHGKGRQKHVPAASKSTANHQVAAAAPKAATLSQPAAQDFGSLRDTMAAPERERAKALTELCLKARSFVSESDRACQTPLFRLAAALETLFKKFLENPARAVPSSIESALLALQLLQDLHRTGNKANLLDPPAKIMIVDDDPIARRAITAAVQLSFGKPESLDSGETAVTAAEKSAFDLIFLDVRMPGMDGFSACKGIREGKLNRDTPIIFVTSHTDIELQKHCSATGAAGYMSKPALPVEVTLTALTHVLRRRFGQGNERTGEGAQKVPPRVEPAHELALC